MRKRLTNIILILVLLAGLSLLLYPTVADWWNRFHQSRAIAGYTEAVESLTDEEYRRMWEEAVAYNDTLPSRANRYVPDEEAHEQYMNTLDVTGTGIMGYIEIPSINVSLPIYHTAEDTVLQIAAGHIEGTSLPVGGRGQHCVISGHRGLPSARLFTDLDKLAVGDIFVLKVLDRTLTYQVDQITIVEPEKVQDLELTPGRDYCTLVTCTPYGVNSHRLLIRGERTSDLPEELELNVEAGAEQIEPLLVAVGIAAPILLVMLAVVLVKSRKRKKQ